MADEQPQDAASVTDREASAASTSDESEAARIANLERPLTERQRQGQRDGDPVTDYMRRWHTAQADFANYKRRTQQEQEQRERLLAAQALAPVINAMDSLERAFIALPATLRSFSWIEGIALVELQLRRALEIQGIHAIDVEPGEPFDPARHEPIGEVETGEHPAGHVAALAQRGYEVSGLLIRPALVQLARKPAEQPADSQDSSASAVSADEATEATPGT